MRQPARDDLRDAVGPHRDAVEDVGGLHRALLVRDDDELRPVGVGAQEPGEAADVRVVERGLDLVEEVERARPGEEQAEQERDRAERLLAAREQRQARDALAGRTQLDLDARLARSSSSGSVSRRRPSPPGNSVADDLGEVLLDRGEGLLEALLDRLGQLAAELLELLEAPLEVGALRRRARRGAPSRPRTPPSRAGSPGRAARGGARAARAASASSSRSSPSAGSAPAASSRRCASSRSALDARELDVDRGQPLGRLDGRAAKLDLLGAEPAQLGAELGGARGARVDDAARSGASNHSTSSVQSGDEPVGARRDPAKDRGIGVHARTSRGPPRLLALPLRPRRPSGRPPRRELPAPRPRRRARGAAPRARAARASAVSPANQSSPRTGIPADALGGHGRHGGGEQLVERDDRQLARRARADRGRRGRRASRARPRGRAGRARARAPGRPRAPPTRDGRAPPRRRARRRRRRRAARARAARPARRARAPPAAAPRARRATARARRGARG